MLVLSIIEGNGCAGDEVFLVQPFSVSVKGYGCSYVVSVDCNAGNRRAGIMKLLAMICRRSSAKM